MNAAAVLALPARTVCLECRLADGDDGVDLALCLAANTAHLETALEALGERYSSNPGWQCSIELLVRWAGQSESPLGAVPFLFTAFDLEHDTSKLGVPCLSLCADPSFFMRSVGLPVPRAPVAWPLELLEFCSSSLAVDFPTETLRQRARACLTAVEDTEVRQLSLMLGREPATVKFDVTLPIADLERFLGENGWTGNAADVLERLSWLAPWQRRVQMNHVVHPSSVPSPLEVELCCTGPHEPTIEERAALLERLVTCDLVSADKASALLELLRRPSIIDDGGHWVARNWYLKLRFDGGRPTAAKAYIGLMQRSVGDAANVRERALSLNEH